VPIRRLPLVLLPLLALPLALPASAATSTLEDPCGDAGRIHESPGFRVDLEDGRVPGFDIKAATMTDLGEPGDEAGVAVALELCGDVPAPELQGSVWRVAWGLSDACNGSVRLNDVLRGGEVVRTAFVGKGCTEGRTVPVTGQPYSTASSVYDVELPAAAWTVDGSTITFTLAPELLGQAAEQVEPGVLLAGLHSDTRDAQFMIFAPILVILMI
jgi:hypothetical protein